LSGTEAIGGTVDFTDEQIPAITLAFGDGYFACTEGEDTTTLTLAMGTNSAAQAWNEFKDTLESGLSGTFCSSVPEALSYSLEI
jgi:hypothetical protein